MARTRGTTRTPHAEALKLLLSSDISVYSIGLDSAVLLRGTTDLSHYAHTTGGDVYYAAPGCRAGSGVRAARRSR